MSQNNKKKRRNLLKFDPVNTGITARLKTSGTELNKVSSGEEAIGIIAPVIASDGKLAEADSSYLQKPHISLKTVLIQEKEFQTGYLSWSPIEL